MAVSDFDDNEDIRLIIAFDKNGNPAWSEKKDSKGITRTIAKPPTQMTSNSDQYFQQGPLNNINLLKMEEIAVIAYQQLDASGQPILDNNGQPEVNVRCHIRCWLC